MALNPASPLAPLLMAPINAGTVQWIGLRPARHAEMRVVAAAQLDCDQGLVGDHYSGTRRSRQVTIIQAEHLAAIAGYLRHAPIDPALVRRNVVVSGINLLALKDGRFQLGSAVLETTGECHPCSRMETALGVGGYNAMRGHGGINARVVQAGVVRLGDALVRVA